MWDWLHYAAYSAYSAFGIVENNQLSLNPSHDSTHLNRSK